MRLAEEERKEWAPNPDKYKAQWMKMWYGIIDSRRWAIRQSHGDECAQLYEPQVEERDFFLQYGKLPHNAVGMRTSPQSTEWLQPPCEKCDQTYARAVIAIVDNYHSKFWKAADRKFGDKRAKYEERLAKQQKAVEATEQWKADKDSRKQLDDYLSQFVANLKADGEETKHQGRQQGEQAVAGGHQPKEADSAEANTNTAAQ